MAKTRRSEMRFDELVACYKEQWDSVQQYRYLEPRKKGNYVIFPRFEFTMDYQRYTVFIYRGLKVKIGNPQRGTVRSENRYEEVLKLRYEPTPVATPEEPLFYGTIQLMHYDNESVYKFGEKMLGAYKSFC